MHRSLTKGRLTAAVLGVAAASLGACASGGDGGGLTTAQIRLDDDGMSAASGMQRVSARRPSLHSPVAQICAYPGGKEVLDRDLPGLTTRPEYSFFQHMTLKTLQGMSRGQLRDDDLAKVDADLRALP